VSFLKKKYEPDLYELLVKVKKALDPNDILNRGNLQGWI
jgi:FAD/FMN-containing dehydrogenase